MKTLIFTISFLVASISLSMAQTKNPPMSIDAQLSLLINWVEDMEGAAGRDALQSIENTKDLWTTMKNMGIAPDQFKTTIQSLSDELLKLAKMKQVDITDTEQAVTHLFEDVQLSKPAEDKSDKGPFHCYDQFVQGAKIAALSSAQTKQLSTDDMASLVFVKALVQTNSVFDACILENY